MTTDDFERALMDELDTVEAFEPFSIYNPDGDCLEFVFSNEPFYGKRLDGWVTVYYSEADGEIVGVLIKGVKSNLMKRWPGLRIDIEAGPMSVSVLLRAPAWSTDDEMKQKTYRQVIDKVESIERGREGLRADLQPA